MPEATRKGATDKDKPELKGPQPDLARFNQVEEIAQHLREQREKDIKSQRGTDPGFKAMDDAMNAELDDGSEEEEVEETEELETAEEGSEEEETEELEASSEEEDDETGEEEEPEEPVRAKKGDDPLADFIVQENGRPMFRAKVDGKTKLIPLDRARAQLQKHEAAEARLQEAANWKKHLEEREQALRHNEQVFRDRIEKMRSTTAPPSQKSDVDVEDLRKEAKELVGTIFSGTEEEAAEKLVKVLAHSRAPGTQAPAFNPDEITRRAAEEAQRRIRAEQMARDSKEGYDKFSAEYPDILTDPYLFKVADGMTDEIAQEHPDWMPSRVMLEAGKRTREWRKNQQSEDEGAEDTQNGVGDLQNRQSRKAQLKPMPRSATRRPSKKPEARPQTPQEILREMRESRNQPV